jgi:glycerol kinase
MQRVADLLGARVAVAAEEEATVVGACALVALRDGTVSLDDLRQRRARSQAHYQPRISADERGARMARFGRALLLARQWR